MFNSLLKKPSASQKEPVFSTDWFSDMAETWLDQLSEFQGKSNVHYLEIGIFEGRSLIWMLENILTGKHSTATGIDIFNCSSRQGLQQNLDCLGISKKKYQILEGSSRSLLRDLKPNSYDIIYIDGDHRGQGALMDAVLSWDLIKEGGILIYDDYTIHAEINPPEGNVKISGDCFLTLFQNELEVLYHDYNKQFFIKRVPLRNGDYMTQAGPFCFVWGEKVEDRHIIDSRTNTLVELPQAALNELAEKLLARKLGILRLDTDNVSKEHLDVLLEKVPNFFNS